MNTLRLPLKKKWFEMTKEGIKTEDYREINERWVRRLTQCDIDLTDAKNELLKGGKEAVKKYPGLLGLPLHFLAKKFDTTTLTLGYPSNSDKERIIEFKNLGISIGYGKEEWGAEKDKLYFVIKHGKQLN